MAEILKGAPVAAQIEEDLKTRVAELAAHNKTVKLAIVRVGESPDDLAYERGILKRMSAIGAEAYVHALPADTTQEDLEECLVEFNDDHDIDAVLLFRPLSEGLNEERACNLVRSAKDVDCMGRAAKALVFEGSTSGFAPCTAEAVLRLLDYYEISLEGKAVAVIGRSLVIGKPVAMLLLDRNATVTICHSHTQNLTEICRTSDIVVCATGKAGLINADMLSEKSVVVDVGINVDAAGNLVGDVAPEGLDQALAAYTPVPGGVGSITTAVLAEHVVRAAEVHLAHHAHHAHHSHD